MKPFGKYQLVRRLAAGGMAEVYLATGPNPRGDELVALKLILQHIAEDEDFQSMFLQEAKLTAPLTHPNLVQVFDLGMDDGRLYLAMEYIRGRPLSEVLRKATEKGQKVGPQLAGAAVRQACLGLHHAHEARNDKGESLGLVHRDVSPQNLMLDQDGLVKVVDFGVAKATSQSEVSRAGSLKGKVGYMSPEQLKSKPIDRRADVFALGAVLFELASGQALYGGRTDAEVLQKMLFEKPPDLRAHGLPEPLVQIIEKAIERDRNKRYLTALAMADALEDWLGQPPRAGPRQLAALVSSLFPPLPRTVAEAEAEAEKSHSGKKTGSGPLVIRREDVVPEARPARQSTSQARLPAGAERARSRPELPAARPPAITGPTDPAGRPGAEGAEPTVVRPPERSGPNRRLARPGPEPEPDENMPTAQVRPPRLGPEGLPDLSEPPDPRQPVTAPEAPRRQLRQVRSRPVPVVPDLPDASEDDGEATVSQVSTVSHAESPLFAERRSRRRLVLLGAAVLALLALGLAAAWRVAGPAAAPAPAVPSGR